MKLLASLFLVVVLYALSALPSTAADSPDAEAAVMRVLDDYMVAFNSGDGKAWAATLNYPHVRNGVGANDVWNTPEEYAARVQKITWDHSAWDYKKVIQHSETRYHVAIQFSRYDAAGKKLVSNAGVYLVTNDKGHWGVKARFSGLRVPEQPTDISAAEKAGLKVCDKYLATFNARDAAGWAATLNYPHVRVSDTGVNVWPTAKDYTDSRDFKTFAERAGGWHHSTWDDKKVIQATDDMVIVALQFSRYREDNTKISTFPTLYLITLQDGHWGIRARSSFAP